MPDLSASVVIPSYNHGAFIDQALASVLLPAYPRLDVVVVDDGSGDDTRSRLERWRSDRRLRIFEQDNRGAHDALNRGISASRGEVVFILNSDDAFHPERVARFLELFARDHRLVMLGSWIELIDEHGGSLGIKRAYHNMPPWPPRGGGRRLSDTGDPTLALLEANYLATTSNVAFRRRAGDAFLPLRYAHDWDFMLGACQRGSYRVVEEPLVRYRVHRSNTIAEGRRAELGRGHMRFEIMWVIARHAAAILGHAAEDGASGRRGELERLLWRSLPPFADESIFSQLLLLRGRQRRPPPAYEHLLDADHAFRAAAARALALIPGD